MVRSAGRNVRLYVASKPDTSLGGLIQNGSVTEKNFLDMLEILLVTQVEYRVERRQDRHVVTRCDQPLQLGDYDVYCDGTIGVNDEPWVKRVITFANSVREEKFREGIRNRDGKCVFSGVINNRAELGQWSGYQAAHIYPLDAENLWEQNDFGKWITDTIPGQSKINSLQNGFLVQGTLHSEWDNYLMSVNPDDNYKIVVFTYDTWKLDGRTLDPVCRNPQDPHHVSDELLRWHYRQSVFANMRGVGEPVFEHDYPPGSDIMGELREGPFGQEQFELMMANRLRGLVTNDK